MKIRSKLFVITGAFFAGMLLITSLAVWTMSQTSALTRTIDTGNRLIAESQSLRGLLSDLLFGMFSPQMYGMLKDLTYAPRSYTTPREWVSSVEKFKTHFTSFMQLPTVKRLLRDDEMRDKYEAAMTISGKAFLRIDELNHNLKKIEATQALGKEGLYQSLQSNPQDTAVSFFDEVRSTSYYLTNNFGSFLNYFVRSLSEESEIIQRQMLVTFLAITIAIGLFTVVISLVFASRITGSIKGVESAIRRVSLGDFSTEIRIASRDEFGALSDNLNLFVKDLKRNVDSVLNLMRDVGGAVGDRLSLDSILSLVVETTVRDTNASGAAILLVDEMAGALVARAVTGRFPDAFDGRESGGNGFHALGWRPIGLDHPIFGHAARTGEAVFIRDSRNDARMSRPSVAAGGTVESVIALPLAISKHVVGVLSIVSMECERRLTDLDFTNLSTFADYTALTIDNYLKYNELIGKREAEYQALQSQVQPHFLYNVLAGLIGLNRMGDSKALESSILALKDMLRYTIEHQEWTTLAEEFQFLDRYCDLQKLRFRDRLVFNLRYDEETARCRIPKLLLQPLVENAIIHGIEPMDREGHLDVTAGFNRAAADPILQICVRDDGIGFEPRPAENGTHIGLSNVRERLSLAFARASLKIVSSPERGTRVDIEIAGKEMEG